MVPSVILHQKISIYFFSDLFELKSLHKILFEQTWRHTCTTEEMIFLFKRYWLQLIGEKRKTWLSLWLIRKSILKRSRRSWRNLQWSAALRRNAIGGMQWFQMQWFLMQCSVTSVQCRDVTLRCSTRLPCLSTSRKDARSLKAED